jgi:ribonuclease P protein component
MAETFRSPERIKRKNDFSHLYHKGKRERGRYLQIIYTSNDLDFSRLGVVVSKKHGNAVKRNKLKRQIRTLFRRNKDLLRCPYDLLVMPISDMNKVTWEMLERDYKDILQSI